MISAKTSSACWPLTTSSSPARQRATTPAARSEPLGHRGRKGESLYRICTSPAPEGSDSPRASRHAWRPHLQLIPGASPVKSLTTAPMTSETCFARPLTRRVADRPNC